MKKPINAFGHLPGRVLIPSLMTLLLVTACDGTPGSKEGSSTLSPAMSTGPESGEKPNSPQGQTGVGQVGAPGSASRSDMTTTPDADATDDLRGASPTPTPNK